MCPVGSGTLMRMVRPVSTAAGEQAPLSPAAIHGGGAPREDVQVIACVIYAAKSTEDKRGSIPDQVDDCRGAIAREPGRRIVGEYTDEAFSAFTGNRGPGLVEAMDRVAELATEQGTAELWAQHSDRLARGDGRSARHAVEIALWALKRDVRVRTVQDPDTFRDLLYAVVTGQRNHEDSRRRGATIAAGRRRAAARGDYLGYKPDGYRAQVQLDESGAVSKRLVIDPDRQPVIETVFRLALRGRGSGVIARALNDAGWLTKPLFRNSQPLPWTGQRVREIVKNPRYAGLSVVKSEVVASGHWPAYITPEEHGRLKARMRPTRPPLRREPYLLTRLARCGLCGGPSVARTQWQRKDGTFNRTYACTGHTQGRHAGRCTATIIPADMIEAMFVASLGLLLDGAHEASEPHAGKAVIPPPSISEVDRRRVIDAVLAGDERRLEATLADLLQRRAPEVALLQRRELARDPRRVELVRPFESWAEQEQLGRTEATRKQARALNRVLRTLFSSVLIAMDETRVRIETVRRPQGGGAEAKSRAQVSFGLQDWMRLAPQARLLRRRYGPWRDAEILGALQAWHDTHGRSPTRREWRAAEIDHPCTQTVLSHFKIWDEALRRASL